MSETYAEAWADAINETYQHADEQFYPDVEDVTEVLTRAAHCLRDGTPATFTGGELDLIRHLMPAHEVHESGAVRWALEYYGEATTWG
jgi:hypothetical protein